MCVGVRVRLSESVCAVGKSVCLSESVREYVCVPLTLKRSSMIAQVNVDQKFPRKTADLELITCMHAYA